MGSKVLIKIELPQVFNGSFCDCSAAGCRLEGPTPAGRRSEAGSRPRLPGALLSLVGLTPQAGLQSAGGAAVSAALQRGGGAGDDIDGGGDTGV